MVSPLGEEATTSQSASFNEEASTSQSPVDSDALYASWLFEEINRSPLSSDLECEEVNDDLAIKYSPKADLTEIIVQLAFSINLKKISKFDIICSNVWEGAVRGLSRKSFAPESKVSVKFCDDLGAAKGAIDHGGPKREFFTLVFDAIINFQISVALKMQNSCLAMQIVKPIITIFTLVKLLHCLLFMVVQGFGVWHQLFMIQSYMVLVLFLLT